MRTPKLEGKWMVVGYQPGRGRVFGTVTVTAGATPDEFTTKTDLEYADGTAALSRTGKGIVYTGFSWRGRSTLPKADTTSTNPGLNPAQWREALMVSRDGNSMQGRWFWGGYEEFGIDAQLTRIGTQTMLAGASVYSIQSPSTTQIRIYGANLPADLKPPDFDLGSGIVVKRVISKTPSMATIEVTADAKLPIGVRDIAVNRIAVERAVSVYDKIDYVKIMPDASMARLGGVVAAKQFAQFEAIAYSAGADGKPQTADDVPVGPVSARWGLEEFVSTPDDDDSKFVGSINDSGLFTPNIEGPNPARQKQSNNFPTNNWGDVWVTATYDSPTGAAMKARSYLVVTIPVYIKYDQPEVGQ
jgi:quinohemoprotein amine dehydrogenase